MSEVYNIITVTVYDDMGHLCHKRVPDLRDETANFFLGITKDDVEQHIDNDIKQNIVTTIGKHGGWINSLANNTITTTQKKVGNNIVIINYDL